MASSGPRYPVTTATLANAGTSENAEAWVNPGNIVSDNATEAAITAATYDSPDISQILVASNFGFTIPVGATIDGILVEVDRRSIIASSGKDFRVQLATGTTFASLVGSNKAVPATIWPTTSGVASYGGAADTWSAGLTAAQVNAAGFAVMLSCQANIANADVGVDYIRVTVTYTVVPITHEAAASISGSAVITAAGASQTQNVASVVSGSVLVSAGATELVPVASVISGSAVVSAVGQIVKPAAASLSGNVVILGDATIVAGIVYHDAEAAVSATATVSGQGSRVAGVASSISGIATVGPGATLRMAAGSVVSGNATVAGTAQRLAGAASAVSGSVVVGAGVTARLAAAGEILGVATQSATASIIGAPVFHDALASISGSAVVGANATARRAVGSVVSGAATVTGGASKQQGAGGILQASGSVTASPSVRMGAAAALSGSVVVVPSLSALWAAEALVEAVAILSGSVTVPSAFPRPDAGEILDETAMGSSVSDGSNGGVLVGVGVTAGATLSDGGVLGGTSSDRTPVTVGASDG